MWSSAKGPLRTRIGLPNSTSKTILQWKINGTWLYLLLKISIKIVHIYLPSSFFWPAGSAEPQNDGWWIPQTFLHHRIMIRPTRKTPQHCLCTPWSFQWSHSQFTIILFSVSYKQEPSKKRGIKQFFPCLKINDNYSFAVIRACQRNHTNI